VCVCVCVCVQVVQIFIGLLCVLFSLTSLLSPVLILHAPLCLAVAFVVSGSVAMAAARRTSLGLVWTCLAWNLLGVALGVVGVAYLCWLLVDGPASRGLCDPVPGSRPSDKPTEDCIQLLRMQE
ncbi:uncharacterized protein si:dkey-7j14.6, partial [Etheostoma cragini]|uniref:uncharacterized protein si:dkey-7j14.6 n=1 Tax=Etheostoma cragini TaxID=417921 RepID=UPI00155EB389